MLLKLISIMAHKGMKITKEGFTLEVTKVSEINDYVRMVEYVVKKGSSELTDGVVFITKDETSGRVLEEVLGKIIRASKRLS